jgi:predicted nucleic acid-binding protein
MFLLDTNVVSELRKSRTPHIHPKVDAWLARVPATDMYLSAIVIEELEVGILRAQRQDPPFGTLLRNWFSTHVVPTFRERVLPVDMAVALASAPFQFPITHPFHDSVIAATALVHGLTVATRNLADFELLGVPVVNPWNG